MRIGILQTGESPDALRPDMGDYPDFFESLLEGQGFTFRRFAVLRGEFPASVTDCDGWLITGSRFGAYEDHAFIPPLEGFIRKAYAAQVPVVGICFGHQIIAQAMGGRVEKYANGWSVGPTDYDFGGEKITLNAWHQDQVVTRPDGAEVAATSGFCENAALIYPGRAFTVQAHPEFSDGFVQGLMDTRARGIVPDALLDVANARMGGKRDNDVLASRIAAFFHAAEDARQGAA